MQSTLDNICRWQIARITRQWVPRFGQTHQHIGTRPFDWMARTIVPEHHTKSATASNHANCYTCNLCSHGTGFGTQRWHASHHLRWPTQFGQASLDDLCRMHDGVGCHFVH
jgi:hypothetical protein